MVADGQRADSSTYAVVDDAGAVEFLEHAIEPAQVERSAVHDDTAAGRIMRDDVVGALFQCSRTECRVAGVRIAGHERQDAVAEFRQPA